MIIKKLEDDAEYLERMIGVHERQQREWQELMDRSKTDVIKLKAEMAEYKLSVSILLKNGVVK